MPPKKQTRSSRGRRPATRPRPTQPVSHDGESAEYPTAPAAPTVTSRVPAARSRSSRAPAQIVIGNYGYLRHDLRLLGILAPSLLIIMVVLSFVLH